MKTILIDMTTLLNGLIKDFYIEQKKWNDTGFASKNMCVLLERIKEIEPSFSPSSIYKYL